MDFELLSVARQALECQTKICSCKQASGRKRRDQIGVTPEKCLRVSSAPVSSSSIDIGQSFSKTAAYITLPSFLFPCDMIATSSESHSIMLMFQI